jgi:hypothetical protein
VQNAEPAPASDDDEGAAGWTFDDVREELARDMAPALWRLSEATTAEDFYRCLAEIILDADKLTASDREFLAGLVSTPWKGRKGRPQDTGMLYEVYWKCVAEPQILGRAPLRPKDAHKLISSLFGWKGEGTEDRARKLLERAVKFVEGEGGTADTDKNLFDLNP